MKTGLATRKIVLGMEVINHQEVALLDPKTIRLLFFKDSD